MSARTIGRLAREVGVNVETIRYYQRKGLLDKPEPLYGKWRHYNAEALMALRFIKLMQRLGFSLREIKELLAYFPDMEGFCQRAGRAAALKISQLEQDIRRLSRVKKLLGDLAETCSQGGDPSECPAWKALLGELD